MKRSLTLFSLIAFATFCSAQPTSSPTENRIQSWKKKQQAMDHSVVHGVKFKSIGPTVMSGRVSDVEVDPDDPTRFYVGYASGGLWETDNNGASFTPLFDHQASITIGDVAVQWGEKPVIWIGTGENNSSRSSYAGTGVYKSIDGGQSWQNMGLIESHHIGRILIHPSNPDILWVAALGHLYSDNGQRGVFKTTDGGKTWKQVLTPRGTEGAIDLVFDPENPDVLYAALWDRDRKAWNFREGGKGSGIMKSIDGGNSWQLVSGENSGFPHGENTGRIGLAFAKTNGKEILYAIVDNQNRRPKEEGKEPDLKEKLKTMSDDEFMDLDEEEIKNYLRKNDFPEKYTVEKVREMVKNKEITPKDLADYTMDANQKLFETPVIGPEIYRLRDDGKWIKTHEGYLDDIYFSYGYYFGQISIDKQNPEWVYIGGVPILMSKDGGKTFESIGGDNVHADHHAIWVDPNRSGHLINGNDGGINISYDNGKHWIKCNSPAVGQFYSVNVDMAKPYRVYGGLQDNGVWMGPSDYKYSDRWQQSGHYAYKMILGGDGMQVEVDTRNNHVVYAGYQFGHYYRINTETGKRIYIHPKHDLGEAPLRFNWQTPIYLSRHNGDIFYMGSDKFHRSLNQAEDMETLSDDLTNGGKQGDVSYGTLTSIHESPLRFGLLYAGTDDGLVHVSKDVGYTWKDMSEGLPKDLWISRVYASTHKLERVYLSLNGYRWDDFKPYLYRSDDYGENWMKIGGNLPDEPVNVVKEDPENENIIYVGTDNGLYISFDKGDTFEPMMNGLPNVAVHDLVIHPRDKEIVIATHGRSLYKADVSIVQKLDSAVFASGLTLFDIEAVRWSSQWGNSWSKWFSNDGPQIEIPFYLGNTAGETPPVTLSVKNENGKLLYSSTVDGASAGLIYAVYDLSVEEDKVKNLKDKKESKDEVKKADNGKYYLVPGEYTIEVKAGKNTAAGKLKITKK